MTWSTAVTSICVISRYADISQIAWEVVAPVGICLFHRWANRYRNLVTCIKVTGLKHERHRIEPEPVISKASQKHLALKGFWNKKSPWSAHPALAPSFPLESPSLSYFLFLPPSDSIPKFLANAFHLFPCFSCGSHYQLFPRLRTQRVMTCPVQVWTHTPPLCVVKWKDLLILWEMQHLITRVDCCADAISGTKFTC